MILKHSIFTLIFAISLVSCEPVIAQKDSDNSSEMTSKLIQPPYLKAGDTVAIVAPSGILKDRKHGVDESVALLKSWGLHVIIGDNVFNDNNHFAGTDDERASDLQKAMDDPTVSAIWCARGGYGTVRVLDKLDYSKFKKHPKWVIGYSDITALHNQLNNEGFESIHGIMCLSLTDELEEIKEPVETFKNAIFKGPTNYEIEGSSYNKEGNSTGQLVGGNLTLLHTMLGSETSIDVSGKILFIEEIGEYKYHIDRMLQSLKRAGYFENCNGVIVGGMSKMRKNTTLWGTSIEQLILDALSEYDFPIAFNVPAGHETDNRALVLGRTIDLKVKKDGTSIVFEE